MLYTRATAAYAKGYSGKGVLVAMVDSGTTAQTIKDLATSGPDGQPYEVFGSRVHEASRDLRPTEKMVVNSHGAKMAGALTAARDGIGSQGIAPEATLLYYNWARTEDAAGPGELRRYDVWAEAMNESIDLGARVMNWSVADSQAPSELIAPLQRAEREGLVLVVSADNNYASDPSPFALGFAENAPTVSIIAGALDSDLEAIEYTNLAGVGRENYLMTIGTGVQSYDNNGNPTPAGGTSVAAAVISGGAALLAEAFPHLHGREIVEILFKSAYDLGDPGVDEIYGHGLMDLKAAFDPVGTVQIAGSNLALGSFDRGILSPAMGDAVIDPGPIAVLDDYRRVYHARPGAIRTAVSPVDSAATGRDGAQIRRNSFRGKHATFDVALAPDPEPRSEAFGRDPIRSVRSFAGSLDIGAKTRVAFSAGHDIGSARMDTHVGAATPMQLGYLVREGTFVGLRQEFGDIAVTAARMEGVVDHLESIPLSDDRFDATRIGISTALGDHVAHFGIESRREDTTVLGARMPLFAQGSDSLFLDAGLTLALPAQWNLSAHRRAGRTTGSGNAALQGSTDLRSAGWSVVLASPRGRKHDDRFTFQVARPLRLVAGEGVWAVPTGYDHAADRTLFDERRISFAPSGTETRYRLSYSQKAGTSGRIDISGQIRTQPFHRSADPAIFSLIASLNASF